MSIDATKWAWAQKDVTPTEKLILLSFADRAGETHEAWPSWSRLILDTGLNRKTIYKNLMSLQKKGKMIKTGEHKRQVLVYKLIGVDGREDKNLSTTSSKKGTGTNLPTSSKNGTSTSSKKGTGTSSKNGTQKPKRNLQRKPNVETTIFSSFSDFKTFVSEEVASTRKEPANQLTEEVLYYADKFKDKCLPIDSVAKAVNCIKKGIWKTPHGFNGFTSRSIIEKDDQYERNKDIEAIELAKMGRSLSKACELEKIKQGDGFKAFQAFKQQFSGTTHANY